MRPTASQYAEALSELSLGAAPEKVSGIVANLFGFLRRRGEEEKIGSIIKNLEMIEAEQSALVCVTAVTAFDPDEETKSLLTAKAEELFVGKKVVLEYKRDADVIGGALFRTDEALYDMTIARELSALKQVLLKRA